MSFCSVWTKILCMSYVEKGCMDFGKMTEATKTCLMCGSRGSCSFEIKCHDCLENIHAVARLGLVISMSDLAE